MKKKVIAVLLTICLVFTGCGGSKSSSASEPAETTPTEETVQDAEATEDDESSYLDALGDLEVEKNLFDVTITVPADFVGETTQEELDAEAAEIGYKVTLNEDGSATYVMTKIQHKELMKGISDSMNESFTEMIGSEEYPNITDISANDDFTSFTVTTKNTEPDMNESFAVMIFYMAGGMYQIFNGTTADNIHVDYVNADSGEVISSADSKDMEENLEEE